MRASLSFLFLLSLLSPLLSAAYTYTSVGTYAGGSNPYQIVADNQGNLYAPGGNLYLGINKWQYNGGSSYTAVPNWAPYYVGNGIQGLCLWNNVMYAPNCCLGGMYQYNLATGTGVAWGPAGSAYGNSPWQCGINPVDTLVIKLDRFIGAS